MEKIARLVVLGFLIIGLSACGRMGALEVQPQVAQTPPLSYAQAAYYAQSVPYSKGPLSIKPSQYSTNNYPSRFATHPQTQSPQKSIKIDTNGTYVAEPYYAEPVVDAPVARYQLKSSASSSAVTSQAFDTNTSNTYSVAVPELDILPYQSK